MNDEMWNEFDDVTAEMINSENSSGRRIVEFDEVLYNCIAETARTELRNTLEKLDELGVKLVDIESIMGDQIAIEMITQDHPEVTVEEAEKFWLKHKKNGPKNPWDASILFSMSKLVEGTTHGKILVVGGHGTGKSMLHQLADLVEDKGEFYLGRIMDNAIIDDCTAYPTKEKGAQWKREQAGRGKRFR